MRLNSKLLLTALVACITMAFAVSTASAGRLSINTTDIDIIWTALVLGAPIGNDVSCAVTLLGSFHSRTIRKTNNALIGAITNTSLGACSEGAATILDETLPWHITYQSFAGTLPIITRATLQVRGAAFEIDNRSAICLATTSATEPGRGIATVNASGQITSLAAEGSIDLNPGSTGDEICDFLSANGTFNGSAQVREEITGTGLVFIRLI